MALFDPKYRVVEGINSFGKPRTPPGQKATVKFPVLTYGQIPGIDLSEWRFHIWGEVEEDVIFAHTFNGLPLPREHGGPIRVFTPRRYAWKGAKWVNGLEFMVIDRPGFWELNGYNTPADPWKEERYG